MRAWEAQPTPADWTLAGVLAIEAEEGPWGQRNIAYALAGARRAGYEEGQNAILDAMSSDRPT